MTADIFRTMGHHGIEDWQASIRAAIPLDQIDCPETVATWLNRIEDEIRTVDGAVLQIHAIERTPGGEERWEEVPVDWSDQNVPDDSPSP